MKIQLFIYFILLSFILNEDIIDDVEVLKNRAWVDHGNKTGAHYYAYSPYTTGYSRVTTYVKLPKKLFTKGGSRKAYISFGVGGSSGSIDMGIMNSGNGWYPYHYDVNKTEFKAYKNYFEPYGTEFVALDLEIIPERIIIFAVSFRDSNNDVMSFFSVRIDASHTLIYENGRVKNRFYRFASLIPEGEDNQNDGTYMIGGQFTNLVIVRNNFGYDWGIAGEDIDVAWKVSTKRIHFSYDNKNDYFDIAHIEGGIMPI